MSLPGFRAEASLLRVGDRRYIGATKTAVKLESSQMVVPQGFECDYAVRCINGIRYLTTDCEDGSGDTVAIGIC